MTYSKKRGQEKKKKGGQNASALRKPRRGHAAGRLLLGIDLSASAKRDIKPRFPFETAHHALYCGRNIPTESGGTGMDFKDLVSLYFERSSAMQVFWNFYVTIALGLIAFFGSIKPSPRTRQLAAILSLAFVVFACVNLNALRGVTNQRIVAASLIKSSHVKDGSQGQVSAIGGTLNCPRVGQVTRLHVISDVLVLVAIWFLALRKRDA